jgi:caffeoyl-CoA O-methyltransferase
MQRAIFQTGRMLMKAIVPAEIEAYATAHSMGESDICRALREETHRQTDCPQMLVGPLEGAFLKVLTQTVRATHVLEIGMFTGYSALCFAEALPKAGTVTTCEIDETSAALARRHFAKSPHGRKITVRMGPALETMQGLSGRYDVIFIDADKQNYLNYYRRAKELLSGDGVIVIDNVLWEGDVLLSPPPDERTAAIQELNRAVASDHDVSAVLLTIRDGVLLIRRKA